MSRGQEGQLGARLAIKVDFDIVTEIYASRKERNCSFLANVLRYVRYMLSAVRLLSVCLLSVCDVGAPYSGG